MAIVMTNTLKNALLTAAGVQLSGGTLEVQAANDAEVATLTLSADSTNALNSPSNGSTTFKALTQDSHATGGVGTKFEMNNSGGTQLYTGTLTATGAGGDLTIASTTIAVGAVVTAGTITVNM